MSGRNKKMAYFFSFRFHVKQIKKATQHKVENYICTLWLFKQPNAITEVKAEI